MRSSPLISVDMYKMFKKNFFLKCQHSSCWFDFYFLLIFQHFGTEGLILLNEVTRKPAAVVEAPLRRGLET